MPAPDTFGQRLDARVATALDQRLLARISSGRESGLSRALACLLVTPVHLVSLLVVAAAVAMVVLGEGWWSWVVAAFLLLVAWFTRPTLLAPAVPGTQLVDQAAAPALTHLVAEICTLAGTRPPEEIRVMSDYNAAVARRGLRGRQLVIGAAMWAAQRPQERLAVLGHEVGHLAHGDLLSGGYVGGGYRTLAGWAALLRPADRDAVWLHLLMAPPRWLVLGYLRGLHAVNSTARRRQELYADLTSALVAGTDAAVSSLELDLLQDAFDVAANRAALDASRPHLGDAIAARAAAYDLRQRTAARTEAADDLRRIDASHPPTVDRLELLERVDPSPPGLVLDSARSRRIDDELRPLLDAAFKRLGDGYRYVR